MLGFYSRRFVQHDYCAIELALLYVANDVDADTFTNVKMNVWVPSAVFIDQFQAHELAECRRKANREMTARHRLINYNFAKFVELMDNRCRIIPESAAGLGKGDPDPRAREQCFAQILFKLSYLPGQCRLSYIQYLRCSRKITEFCNLKKVADLPEVHIWRDELKTSACQRYLPQSLHASSRLSVHCSPHALRQNQ